MWFDILKESKQISRTVGSVDWEEEAIPDSEDEDCLQWIRELRDLTNKFGDIVLLDPEIIEGQYIDFFGEIGDVPNEIVCKVIQHIKDNPDNYYAESDWREIKGTDYGYVFQHYFGDGHQAYIKIGKSWNDSPIEVGFNTHHSEPYENHIRTTLRSWDGKSGKPNPDYLGEETGEKLKAAAHKINAHMQELWPYAEKYSWFGPKF